MLQAALCTLVRPTSAPRPRVWETEPRGGAFIPFGGGATTRTPFESSPLPA